CWPEAYLGPSAGIVVRLVDAVLAVDESNDVDGRSCSTWCGFAEPEAIHFLYIRDCGPGRRPVSRLIEAFSKWSASAIVRLWPARVVQLASNARNRLHLCVKS